MSIFNGDAVNGTPEWAEGVRVVFRAAGNVVPESKEVARVDLNTADPKLSGSVPVDIHSAVYRGEITNIPVQFRAVAAKSGIVTATAPRNDPFPRSIPSALHAALNGG